MLYVVRVVRGSGAVIAWRAYMSNRTRFGSADLVVHARTLNVPDLLYLALPKESTAAAANTPKDLGKEACGCLSLGPLVRSKHRQIFFVHVRTHLYGDGQASRLVYAAQEDAAAVKGNLTVSSPACRTWYATLLFLRNGFIGDENLMSADIRLFESMVVTANTSIITFTWTPGAEVADHIRYVERVRRAQETARHTEFAVELAHVVRHLERMG